jgi:hypothetical protein
MGKALNGFTDIEKSLRVVKIRLFKDIGYQRVLRENRYILKVLYGIVHIYKRAYTSVSGAQIG